MAVFSDDSDIQCEPANGHCQSRPDPSVRQERFVQLFAASYHALYSYIMALVANRTDADDLMQETSLLLWRKFEDFDPETDDPVGDFGRWGRTFARNVARNFQRMQSRTPRAFDDELLAKLAAVHVHADELLEMRRKALRRCVDKLSPADRELLRICYGAHRSVASACRQLEHPTDAVYKRLRRIRRALFQCVDRTLDLER